MEAKLCYIGHGLMENRSGLIVDTRLTLVSGHAERLAALEMIEPHADRPRAITLGADKGYDAADFVEESRTMNVRPHVAQKRATRRSTGGRPGTLAMPPASASASASRRPSAGSSPSAGCARPASRQDGLGLHLRRSGLQPGAAAEAAGGGRLMPGKRPSALAAPFQGRWRIAEIDLCAWSPS